MNTATLKEIDKNINNFFYTHDHFINDHEFGQCKIVAIHGKDQSTLNAYNHAKVNSLMVSLKPCSGIPQIKRFIDINTVFTIRPATR